MSVVLQTVPASSEPLTHSAQALGVPYQLLCSPVRNAGVKARSKPHCGLSTVVARAAVVPVRWHTSMATLATSLFGHVYQYVCLVYVVCVLMLRNSGPKGLKLADCLSFQACTADPPAVRQRVTLKARDRFGFETTCETQYAQDLTVEQDFPVQYSAGPYCPSDTHRMLSCGSLL